MRWADGPTDSPILALEDAPRVVWVAGDEQAVLIPGARGFKSQLPSENLLSVLHRFRAVRLLACAVFVTFVLCFMYFHFFVFSSPPTMGQTLTTPLSLTLDHWK